MHTGPTHQKYNNPEHTRQLYLYAAGRAASGHAVQPRRHSSNANDRTRGAPVARRQPLAPTRRGKSFDDAMTLDG